LSVDPRYLDRDGNSIDSPMTDYERETLNELRVIFDRPYAVYKVKVGQRRDGFGWDPDFFVSKDRKAFMVIKLLGEDTTAENLDSRMRDAFAIIASNWEGSRHGGDLASRSRAVIVPDHVLDEIGEEGSNKYHYIFEPFGCEVIGRKAIAELELHRDKEDRERHPIKWWN
jgi:hypothetical protein